MGLGQHIRGSLIDAYLGERLAKVKRYGQRALGNAGRLEFYYRVDDPYSHLLIQVLPRLLERHQLALSFFTVGASTPAYDPQPALRAAYALQDAQERLAHHPLNFPSPASVPTAARTRLANAIMLNDREPQTQLEVGHAVGEALLRGDDQALTRAATRWGRIEEAAIEAQLQAGTARLERKGHYQGGMLRYLGEWFWGIDRIEFLEARLGHDAATMNSCLPAHDAPPTAPPGATPPSLDFFFSFRSPYSYLAIDQVAALQDRYDLTLQIKPVLPMVMRGLSVPRAKRLYIARDCKRLALRQKIPFGRICDPLGPGIERCLAVFMHAREQGRALPFIRSAGRGIWSEALDVASDADLKRIVERTGLSWPEARRSLTESDWPAMTEAHREELSRLGLWGVPSFHLADYAVWGQDRLADIAQRLAQGTH